MNVLDFKIERSDESNDHQVRIRIDGEDFLEGYLGLDPPEFFRQKTLLENGNLIIGRCDCGCVGCDDISVNVQFENDKVIWITEEDSKLTFDKRSYLRIIEETSKDFSWENLNRRVERLLGEIFDKTVIDKDFSFDWASARIEPKVIKLSFRKNENQKLHQFGWDGKTLESAIENARLFYRKHFKLK